MKLPLRECGLAGNSARFLPSLPMQRSVWYDRIMIPMTSLQLTVNLIKEKKQVIAYSPALDISTVGDSEEHAKTRFVELVRMFMNDITERNVADEVLADLGWQKVRAGPRPHWVPPKVTSVDLQVPIAA